MAGKPKYTPRKLEKAANAYLDSISRLVPVTESVPSGKFDSYGHPEMVEKTALNRNGEPVLKEEFLIPPLEGNIAKALGIDSDTWTNYGNPSKHPEHAKVVAAVKDRIIAWNLNELVTREGKNTKGIMFNLSANYGISEKTETKQTVSMSLEEFLSRD